MLTCECGRSFKRECDLKLHKPHCKGLRRCNNPSCNKYLTGFQVKYCSSKCSAIMTTPGRKHSEETKRKISLAQGGSGNILKNKCLNCGKKTSNKKFCSRKCDFAYKRKIKKYEEKNFYIRKKLLWIEQGCRCKKCGFNLYGPLDGPYEIHHKDGDRNNKIRENEELLCCNCHFMTDNYRFKGRNHTKESKQKISKARIAQRI